MLDHQLLFRGLYLIRRFEEIVLANFHKGQFFGTTHTYLGQEADAVGVISCLKDGDIVFSNHRCHGHYLAYGGDPRALFAELMGKKTGVCGGRGGSQHLHWRNFYSNGVQGGILPIATGMALAEKIKRSQRVTVVFLGDGTLGEGVVYEALNLASLWQVPILFVLENNRIAQTTPIDQAVAGSLAERFTAFGLSVDELDTSDVCEIAPVAEHKIRQVRALKKPEALIINTCRFGPHSKGDDTRAPELIADMRRERDPVAIQAARLAAECRQAITEEVEQALAVAYKQAADDPFPTPADLA
jgi:TPP-dependent pyruvate/acetoin dehydrogenase alpha subunit